MKYLPVTLAALAVLGFCGLAGLRLNLDQINNWNGPYLPKDPPLDAWGRAFLYRYPGDHGPGPDILSLGADGKAGGEGLNSDIVSWNLNLYANN